MSTTLPTPAAAREPRRRARRRARAFEAFMGEQALALHRTMAAAGGVVRGMRLPIGREPASGPAPAC